MATFISLNFYFTGLVNANPFLLHPLNTGFNSGAALLNIIGNIFNKIGTTLLGHYTTLPAPITAPVLCYCQTNSHVADLL